MQQFHLIQEILEGAWLYFQTKTFESFEDIANDDYLKRLFDPRLASLFKAKERTSFVHRIVSFKNGKAIDSSGFIKEFLMTMRYYQTESEHMDLLLNSKAFRQYWQSGPTRLAVTPEFFINQNQIGELQIPPIFVEMKTLFATEEDIQKGKSLLDHYVFKRKIKRLGYTQFGWMMYRYAQKLLEHKSLEMDLLLISDLQRQDQSQEFEAQKEDVLLAFCKKQIQKIATAEDTRDRFTDEVISEILERIHFSFESYWLLDEYATAPSA